MLNVFLNKGAYFLWEFCIFLTQEESQALKCNRWESLLSWGLRPQSASYFDKNAVVFTPLFLNLVSDTYGYLDSNLEFSWNGFSYLGLIYTMSQKAWFNAYVGLCRENNGTDIEQVQEFKR